MSDQDDPNLGSVQERLRFQLTERVDFTDTSTESTLTKVRILSAAAVYFNIVAITDFGCRAGTVRQVGMVEQIVGSAFQTFAAEDPHPTPFDKAAVLLRGITQGHPFTDGNKRMGFLVALFYLNGVGFAVRQDLPVAEIVSFCRSI